MTFKWPKASRNQSIAAASFTSSEAPSSDGNAATASNITDGCARERLICKDLFALGGGHAADLGRDNRKLRAFFLHRLAQRVE